MKKASRYGVVDAAIVSVEGSVNAFTRKFAPSSRDIEVYLMP